MHPSKASLTSPTSARPSVTRRARIVALVVGWLLVGLASSEILAQEPARKADPAERRDTEGSPQKADARAGNEKVAEIIRTFGGRGVMSDGSSPTPAELAVKQFRMREGFAIDLVASEPAISQPLFLSWDSRGRLWVVQYRQYQFPAGLKVVRYDQHLRAVFDRVPPPPPHGPVGEDRITVFEDTDGDGVHDTHKDVITGLNIVSSVAIGHGGIWVLQPPYLLFYPDADADDVPDSDPEVHLSGFGLQDTHSVANSLLWGPDGWLYGANGSTTTGSVSSAVTRGVQFEGQCIWRYHPDSHVFEIWAEGGGNTFSLEIDAKGRVFSGTNGGGTRGFHYPQGSYSRKNWGKHGPLTNPHAYGFFESMRFEGDGRRFPQAFTIYEGGLFPAEFDGDVLSPNAMANLVWHSRRLPDGSTFRTVDQENLLESPDRWFRPVYSGVGPDGAFYIADWYDTRLSHVSPVDDWHKTSGRVYRVRPVDTAPAYREGDLAKRPVQELVALLSHRNKWTRRRATLELGWRGDRSVVPQLVEQVDARSSLESLQALDLLGELTSSRAKKWLSHEDAHIRRWVVRILGDRHEGLPELTLLAEREEDVEVRSQLASSAKRLPSSHALPILRHLLAHREDLEDLHLPLLLWWGIEAHASSFEELERIFANASLWREPIVAREIVQRLAQRHAAGDSAEDLARCARLFELAPDDASRARVLDGLASAFEGRSLPVLPETLELALEKARAALGSSGLVLGIRQGSEAAIRDALRALGDSNELLALRLELVRVLGETRRAESVPTLLRLATGNATRDAALQRAAIAALAAFDDENIPAQLIQGFGANISRADELRSTAIRTLSSRLSWARRLVREFAEWRLFETEMPADVLQRLRSYEDPELAREVLAVFGPARTISSAEKRERIEGLRGVLSESPGDASRGKTHFDALCATCHQLFGEGKRIGPPLDAHDRGNVDFWLNAIVEPSLEIREGFASYLAVTRDGRTLTGRIADQDPAKVTLLSAEDQTMQLERAELLEFRALDTSLMPENLLEKLPDDAIRDLFAYMSQGAR